MGLAPPPFGLAPPSPLTLHGAELVRHGFGPTDAQQLLDARDALQAERVERGAEVTGKGISRQAVRTALAQAGAERDAARAILSGAAMQLREAGDAEGASKIQEALRLTAVAPANDAGLFADQLEHLHGTLTDPALAPAAADRGGPAAALDLAALVVTLRTAAQGCHRGRGTPVATERLDLLDGVVVTLARRAYKAARAAGKRLGTPALATEFKLTYVVKKARGRAVEAPPTTPKAPTVFHAPASSQAPAPSPA